MLNVTIQNDGKIKIQTECSDVKEMRSNVNLLLSVVSSMEMEEKVNKDANGIPVQSTNYLYLDKVDDCNKLSTVSTLSKQLNISLKEAKAIADRAVDDKHNILVASSVDLDFINNVRNALESVGCICRITSGM